jgi:CheY-like chemotaxis protein
MNSEETKTILLVEDDVAALETLKTRFEDAGFLVKKTSSLSEAQDIISSSPIDVVIADVWLDAKKEKNKKIVNSTEFMMGHRAGFLLGRWITKAFPKIFFLAYSGSADREVIDWFNMYGGGFFSKTPYRPRDLVVHVCKNLRIPLVKGPQSFIVHGHDENLRLELINYLTGRLAFPMPIILKDESEDGRIIIEKLEELSENVDVVFVLLTPDDICISVEEKNTKLQRARQNVILELGYFLGKFGRKSGKIILVKKGEVELPSNLNGLLFIEISDTVLAAGEKFRV